MRIDFSSDTMGHNTQSHNTGGYLPIAVWQVGTFLLLWGTVPSLTLHQGHLALKSRNEGTETAGSPRKDAQCWSNTAGLFRMGTLL